MYLILDTIYDEYFSPPQLLDNLDRADLYPKIGALDQQLKEGLKRKFKAEVGVSSHVKMKTMSQ